MSPAPAAGAGAPWRLAAAAIHTAEAIIRAEAMLCQGPLSGDGADHEQPHREREADPGGLGQRPGPGDRHPGHYGADGEQHANTRQGVPAIAPGAGPLTRSPGGRSDP